MKKYPSWMVATIAGLLIATAITWFIVPSIILQPGRLIVYGDQPYPGNRGEQVLTIQADDGVDLYGRLLTVKDPKGCVILIHGIGACGDLMLETALAFRDHQYEVLVVDLRAHGRSGGSFCTYGYLEKSDIACWVNYLEGIHKGLPTGVYGSSLGGAVALQALAHDNRLDFGIIECTFDRLNHVVRDYAARHVGFHIDWYADIALWCSGIKASFEPSDVSPAEASRNIRVPVIMAHGTRDAHISIHHGVNNFIALASPVKYFIPVRGADHNTIGDKGGEEYRVRLFRFVDLACEAVPGHP